MPPDAPPQITAETVTAFDAFLVSGDEEAAVDLVLGLAERGVPPERLLLDLVAPVQEAVGARWATGAWSVAREHTATHVSGKAVEALARHAPREPVFPGETVVACADGEGHAMPARILAEVLRLRGFGVRYLGAHLSAPHLVSHLHEHGSELVALSCTLPVHLPRAHPMIEGARRAGTPVIAGGSGFGPGGVWARILGADLYAAGAAQAADTLARRWPPPLTGEPALDHLTDGEYTRLAMSRPELLHMVMRELRHTYPEEDYEAAADDAGYLLGYLAAALFVDDPHLFTGFLAAAVSGVVAARALPAAALPTALHVLSGPLGGLPRTATLLRAGQHWLAAHGHPG